MEHERTELKAPLESVFHWNYDVQYPQMDRLYETFNSEQKEEHKAPSSIR